MPIKPAAKKQAAEDPHRIQAVQNYELGVRALQEHKFEKAKGFFQKAMSGPAKALAERAAPNIRACDQNREAPALQFKTAEEHFDFAVSLMNTGDYVTAREHLEKLLKQQPNSDYVLYGLAALSCLTGHVEEALKPLVDATRPNT